LKTLTKLALNPSSPGEIDQHKLEDHTLQAAQPARIAPPGYEPELTLGEIEQHQLDERPPQAEQPARIAPPGYEPELTLGAVDRLFENIRWHRSSRSAFALLYLCLQSGHERVRTASAAALSLLHPMSRKYLFPSLEEATKSTDPVVSEIALAAGGQVDETQSSEASEAAAEGTQQALPLALEDTSPARQKVSIVVHGTFARIVPNGWHRPSADLPVRIRNECTPDLYEESDFFRWSGGYSPEQRSVGAKRLIAWCRKRGFTELDTVYAHSHGGNVVLNALELGAIKVNLLVLLHMPVLDREPQDWEAIESNVGWIFDLRTPYDWIVSVDGLRNSSRNRFSGQLRCVSLAAGSLLQGSAFSHSHYVKDKTWELHELTNDVAFERGEIAVNRAQLIAEQLGRVF
jgi:hypothetical protein